MPRASQSTEEPTVNGADLAAQIEELRARLTEMVDHLAASGKAGAQTFADSANAEAAHLARLARREGAHLKEEAGDLAEEVTRFLRQRPMAALGIAAGLGLLFGLATARR